MRVFEEYEGFEGTKGCRPRLEGLYTNEECNSNGRKFLYDSKGLDVISFLVKYYAPLAHINKVIKL